MDTRCHFAAENTTVMTVETVKQAMQPLLLTFSVIGLGVYSAKKFHLNVLYNLTIWISYCNLYYYVVITFEVGKFFSSMTYIITLLSAIISAVSVIMCSYQAKVYPTFRINPY